MISLLLFLHENIKIWKLKTEDRIENSGNMFFWTASPGPIFFNCMQFFGKMYQATLRVDLLPSPVWEVLDMNWLIEGFVIFKGIKYIFS